MLSDLDFVCVGCCLTVDETAVDDDDEGTSKTGAGVNVGGAAVLDCVKRFIRDSDFTACVFTSLHL